MEKVKDGVAVFYASSRKSWRQWLQRNHKKTDRVWLVLFNKSSAVPTIDYATAVEEALCFGWIDSKPNKRDHESRYQYFAKRKPKSAWSKLNKTRVAKLTRAGLMTKAGLEMVALAKKTGTWTRLNAIDRMKIPEDLRTAFEKKPGAQKNFENFPPSTRKMILNWINEAKRLETRTKRVEESARLAAKNIRANQWKPNR